MSGIGAVALGATAFVTTNVDGLLVLVGFMSDLRYRSILVAAGQFLGAAVVVSMSILAALAAVAIPQAYLGLLGLAPIAIGLKKLLHKPRLHERPVVMGTTPTATRPSSFHQIASVAAVAIASGGDNLGVYTATFAISGEIDKIVIVSTFAFLTGIWCALSHYLANHRILGQHFRRYAELTLPFILIIVGELIMVECGSNSLIIFREAHMRTRQPFNFHTLTNNTLALL